MYRRIACDDAGMFDTDVPAGEVQEVGGSVERVYDPHQPTGHDLGAPLLADNASRRFRPNRISRIICAAVRSTSVTKSRLPLRVHRAGSAGRRTLSR